MWLYFPNGKKEDKKTILGEGAWGGSRGVTKQNAFCNFHAAAAPAAKETHFKMEQISKIKQVEVLGHITPLH